MQQFHEILRQDWVNVLNQWRNLRATWRDQQFDRFEPLFARLVRTYIDTNRQCEGYITFLQDQIRIAEARQVRMGSLSSEIGGTNPSPRRYSAEMPGPVPPGVNHNNIDKFLRDSIEGSRNK